MSRKGKIYVKVYTLPGDESVLSKIQNDDLIDIIDEKINYNAVLMIYQVYIKYIDFKEDIQTC